MYPILIEAIDLYGCLLVFATLCLVGFVFVLIVLQETTGNSLDDVGVADKSTTNGPHIEHPNNA